MTWESDFKTVLLTSIVFSFINPRNRALYSTILFMHWNCNLVAYEVLTLDGETMTAAPLAPKDPHEPSKKTIQIASSNWVASSYEPAVQSAIKPTNA
jgi:hypothetical protein